MSTIRILGGKFKGRGVSIPPASGPQSNQSSFTPAKIKEAIFQILESEIPNPEDFSFFDLCSGSGQIAIEALSRGFGHIHAVELDQKRFSHLVAEVRKQKYEIQLHKKDFRRLGPVIAESKQAIVFVDPPYSFWDRQGGCAHVSGLLENVHKDLSQGHQLLFLIQGPNPFLGAPREWDTENRQYGQNYVTIVKGYSKQLTL